MSNYNLTPQQRYDRSLGAAITDIGTGNLLHDTFGMCLSLCDMVSDVVLIYSWSLQDSTYIYAQVGFVFLLISQFLYVVIAAGSVSSVRYNFLTKTIVALFACVFGQFVPTLMLLHNRGILVASAKYIPGGAWCYQTFKISISQGNFNGGFPADVNDWTRVHHWQYIMQAHFGFLIEGFVEALPQVCIQLACFVAHPGHQLNWLSSCSMLLSIGSFMTYITILAGQSDAPAPVTKLLSTLPCLDILALLISVSMAFQSDCGLLCDVYFMTVQSVSKIEGFG
jgi:hypothetical protein